MTTNFVPSPPGSRIRQLEFRVRHAKFNLLAIDGRQGVEQVVDVETDLHRVAAVLDLERLDRLFLLGIVGL